MTPSRRQALRRWQAAPGSLTRRLAERDGAVEVRRLRQCVAPLLPGEARDLGVPAGTRCVVREVVLSAGGRPLVWARSVTPCQALRGAWKALAGLGQRPLADLLFDDRGLHRTPLRAETHRRGGVWHARADAAWRVVAGNRWPANAVGARSSVFVRRGSPLRVFEAFVPDIGAPLLRRRPRR